MSRIFPEFPQSKDFETRNATLCPYCNTDDNKPCVLIPIYGTENEGNVQAIVVHHDCLLENLMLLRPNGILSDTMSMIIGIVDPNWIPPE